MKCPRCGKDSVKGYPVPNVSGGKDFVCLNCYRSAKEGARFVFDPDYYCKLNPKQLDEKCIKDCKNCSHGELKKIKGVDKRVIKKKEVADLEKYRNVPSINLKGEIKDPVQI